MAVLRVNLEIAMATVNHAQQALVTLLRPTNVQNVMVHVLWMAIIVFDHNDQLTSVAKSCNILL